MRDQWKTWLQIVAFVLVGIFVGVPVMHGVDNGFRSAGVYALIEALFYGFLILVALFCAWHLLVRSALERLGLMKP